MSTVWIIRLALFAVMLLISILVFRLMMKLKNPFKEAMGSSKNRYISTVNDYYNQKGTLFHQKEHISRYGISYRLKNYDLEVAQYLLIRIAVGFLLAVAFGGQSKPFNVPLAIVMFLVGFFGTDFLFVYLNARDNKAMIEDIYHTYSIIAIQMNAGAYIGNCFEQVYRCVKNERYKYAIGELIVNLSDKNISTLAAVDIFESRFKSTEIKSLCSLIRSILKFGYTKEYMSSCIKDSTALLNSFSIEKGKSAQRRAEYTLFAFFALIIATIAYLMYADFFSSLTI